MNVRKISACTILVLAVLTTAAMAQDVTSGPPPRARTEALTERRFGLTYTDPYRWMENADDPALYTWLKAEAAYTDAWTSGTLREELAAEFLKIFSGDTSASAEAEAMGFDQRRSERHRFKRIDKTGRSTFTTATAASGRYEVVCEPLNTDIQTLRIMDSASGTYLEDILRVKHPVVIWNDDEKSFIYLSYRDGRLGGMTIVVRRHTLGTSQLADATLVEEKDASQDGQLYEDGSRIWLMRWGSKGNRLSSMDRTTGAERTVLRTEPGVFNIFEFSGGKCWAVSFLEQDMGEVVMFDTATRQMTTVVPARDVALDCGALIGGDLYLSYVRNGVNELVRFETGTGTTHEIAMPAPGTVNVTGLDSDTGLVAFTLGTHVAARDTYSYNPVSGEVALVKAGQRPDVELEAIRVQYAAHPGWTAPIWVVKRKDVWLTNETPMCVYGYGGFYANLLPFFSGSYLPWLRRGGAVAFVVLPGGLELGEAWHRLGQSHRKRNVFDAFARATARLIALGWTNREKVVIMGASNGGLLAAATAQYYPGLFRVTVPHVGVMDMGRFSLFTEGPTWITEYGDRDDAEDFRYLMSISPYHKLKDGMRYPSTVVVTADLDDRVYPAHSHKFLARLRATLPEVNALLHVAHGTGHNYLGATPEENARTASIIWTFVMTEIGMR